MLGNITKRLTSGARFGQPVTLIRKGEGAMVGGKWVEGIDERIDKVANVQPASGTEREQLPEGERLKEALMVRMENEVYGFVRVVGDKSPADKFEINGTLYTVLSVQDYSFAGHVECLVLRDEGKA